MQKHGAAKRRKEIARQERKRDKLADRVARKKDKPDGKDPNLPGEDPDIAGIVPGPQPEDPA
jgi:hypothetical protein